MKLGLYVNDGNNLSVSTSIEFIKMLKEQNINYFDIKQQDEKCDLIVVFGGDGTTVRVINYAVKYDIPAIVINTGTVGFFSDFKSNELKEALIAIKDGCYCTERTLLNVEYNGTSAIALNDIVIKRKCDEESTVVKLNVSINNQHVDEYFADGLIFSTPTGSTAYSLSAGGSVITPDSEVFCLTPICAHSFNSRSIVYNDKSIVSVSKKQGSKAVVYVDGNKLFEMGDQPITITKSFSRFKLCLIKNEFFKRLKIKLSRVNL